MGSRSPGPVDLRLVRLPPSAARGEHEVQAVMLEDSGRLAAAPDEDFQVLRLHFRVVRAQLGDVHVLVPLAGVHYICCRIIILQGNGHPCHRSLLCQN